MRARYVSVIAAALVVTDILDLWSTYLATPDLTKELNPLVVGLGLGWSAIIIMHALFLGVLLLGLWFFHKNEAPPSSLPGGIDRVGRIFVWYLTGSSDSERAIQGTGYLVFLCLFVPLGAIGNAVANTTLNLTYYLGLHGGLSTSTALTFHAVKMAAIVGFVLSFFYFYLNKTYLSNRSQ